MNLWNQFLCLLFGHKWSITTVWMTDEGFVPNGESIELRICQRCYDLLELPSAPWEADSHRNNS